MLLKQSCLRDFMPEFPGSLGNAHYYMYLSTVVIQRVQIIVNAEMYLYRTVFESYLFSTVYAAKTYCTGSKLAS